MQIYACLFIPQLQLQLHTMHSKYFLLILLLSIYLRSFSCALNCSEEAFDCGVVDYIAYPFWGGDRPSECGREGFKIVCLQGHIPILKISSLSYIIQKLDFSTNTVIVARQDLHDTYCPQHLHNTTIDHELFKYPPKSTDRNLTLYFDCAADHMQPNSFSCANRTSNNLFKIGDGDASSSSGITSCNSNIYVPVKREDAESLQNPTASSINILHDALTSGFSIQWFNDSLQILSPFCNANVYGSCIRSNAKFVKLTGAIFAGHAISIPSLAPTKKDADAPVPSPSRPISISIPSPAPTKDADAPVRSPAPHIQDSAPVPSYRPMLPPVTPPAGNGLPLLGIMTMTGNIFDEIKLLLFD